MTGEIAAKKEARAAWTEETRGALLERMQMKKDAREVRHFHAEQRVICLFLIISTWIKNIQGYIFSRIFPPRGGERMAAGEKNEKRRKGEKMKKRKREKSEKNEKKKKGEKKKKRGKKKKEKRGKNKEKSK